MSAEYEPQQLLDVGAASEVFLARGPEGSRCAIRHLRSDVRRDGRMARQWLEIGASLKGLGDDHLVNVLDVGDDGGEPWIAMELLEGESLRWVMQRFAAKGRPVPVALAVHLARGVARGLARIHAQEGGPLHNAVVPGKIFVGHEGLVKLLLPSPPPAVSAGTLVTDAQQQERRRYTPPESASGTPRTPGADLWQLGVTLHELLTGEPLFGGATDLDVLRAVISREVKPVSVVRGDDVGGFDAVLLRLLERDLDGRYPDAHALLEDLAKLDVSEEQGVLAARESLGDDDELDDAEVDALDAISPSPLDPDFSPARDDDADTGWESNTDVFNEELSDTIDLSSSLVLEPDAAAAPPPSMPTPRGPPMSFTAPGPLPRPPPTAPDRMGGFRIVRSIDPVHPWERFVVADAEGEPGVLWRRALTPPEAEERERALDALDRAPHPAIAQPIERGYEDGLYFVVYDRAEGAALETLMRGTRDQPSLVVVLLLRDLLGALVTAHKAGFVHGSLRPRTVRITAGGRATLHGLGLGLDGPVGADQPTPSIAYASPEQAAGSRATPASDLFQCGNLLHELLAGKAPFAGATAGETRAALLEARAPSLFAGAPTAPWALEQLHRSLLRRDPAARPPSAEAALRDLAPLLEAADAVAPEGLAAYVADPWAGHARLSRQAAQGEVLIGREAVRETPPRYAAAALALLRAHALDPANDDVAAWLQKTLERAGLTPREGDSRLGELEARVGETPEDPADVAELARVARKERRLLELVRYLSQYLALAPDDARARATLAALAPGDDGAPFSALLRARSRATS